MKFNTKIIVFDLETIGCEPQAIIEIGAIMLDNKLNVLDTYSSLVKPYAPISELATKITGYTDETVQNSPTWDDVGQDFILWTKEYGGPKKCRLAAWGNYFDINVLRNNYTYYKMDYPFSGTAYDIKTVATLWASLSGHRTDKMGVETAARLLKINTDGVKFHTAISDASVTALIFKAIMKQFAGGLWIDGKYLEINIRK